MPQVLTNYNFHRLLGWSFSPRTQLAGLALLALLQRSPALLRVAQVARFAIEPATRIVQKALVAAATLGSYHAVSGATAYVVKYQEPERDPAEITTTAAQTVQIELGQALLIGLSGVLPDPTHQVNSWKVSQSLPPGVTVTGQGGVTPNANRVFNSLNALISGTPTQPGEFQFSVQAFNDDNAGAESMTALNFTLTVVGEPAVATPTLITILPQESDVLVASWPVIEGQTYQLETSRDGADWQPDTRTVTEVDGKQSVEIQRSDVLQPLLLRIASVPL